MSSTFMLYYDTVLDQLLIIAGSMCTMHIIWQLQWLLIMHYMCMARFVHLQYSIFINPTRTLLQLYLQKNISMSSGTYARLKRGQGPGLVWLGSVNLQVLSGLHASACVQFPDHTVQSRAYALGTVKAATVQLWGSLEIQQRPTLVFRMAPSTSLLPSVNP